MQPLLLALALLARPPDANDYFKITVLDADTGRGVPLIELRTVHGVLHVTDSNGIVAFLEPGLMGQQVYFHVKGHGYEHPADGFGNRGVRLRPVAGGNAVVRLRRLNIAERLYRVTGAGIYRDSILTGLSSPLRQPVLNGQVLGQDTVIALPYRGKVYWFWGDTERASYPLGNFAASGAVSELPGAGGLDPAVGVDLEYFTDESGFSKRMCPIPGPGLRWIEALLTLPDETGRERLVARVTNVRDLGHVNDWHLMVFDDEKRVFEPLVRWEMQEPHDASHSFRARVGAEEYWYLYPDLRVKADLKSAADLGKYEAFTCLRAGSPFHAKAPELERDEKGRPRYAWRAGGVRLSPGRLRKLVREGALKAEEAWLQLRDIETGESVAGDRGSVYWNEFRKRWVMIASGKPGEIWFSEGDTPLGPWVHARRVVAHDRYNFYNPTQHPFFDQEGGRLIYFEGTYTAAFSAATEKTPRYDYNQVMYRLALDDERLALPQPVYRVKDASGAARLRMREGVEAEEAWGRIEEVAFFALPPGRGRKGAVPIHAVEEEGGTRLTREPPAGGAGPLFLALPAEGDPVPPMTEVLEHAGKPLCRVWKNPLALLVFDREARPLAAPAAGTGR